VQILKLPGAVQSFDRIIHATRSFEQEINPAYTLYKSPDSGSPGCIATSRGLAKETREGQDWTATRVPPVPVLKQGRRFAFCHCARQQPSALRLGHGPVGGDEFQQVGHLLGAAPGSNPSGIADWPWLWMGHGPYGLNPIGLTTLTVAGGFMYDDAGEGLSGFGLDQVASGIAARLRDWIQNVHQQLLLPLV